MKVKDIIKRLEEEGWVLARQKGSHKQYKHPDKRDLSRYQTMVATRNHR